MHSVIEDNERQCRNNDYSLEYAKSSELEILS